MSRNQFISYGVKGLLRIAKLGLIDTTMDEITRKRLKILHHWSQFGLALAVHAFGFSKSTLYTWRKLLREAGGNSVALKLVSTRPNWKTYPKTPKMNAHFERFNRSIQEFFVDYYEDPLFTALALFNQKMSDWLVSYNTELPHLSTKPNLKKTTSLNNLPITPVQFLLKLSPQSRMYWTHALSGLTHCVPARHADESSTSSVTPMRQFCVSSTD